MSIIELLTFKRLMHESIDDVIARFEAVRSRADNNVQQFNMPIAAIAWMLLEAMRIPRAVWPLLFQPNGGQLPVNEDQLALMTTQIRQQGHLTEHTHAGPRTLHEGQPFRQQGGKGNYYNDHDTEPQQNSWEITSAYLGHPNPDTTYDQNNNGWNDDDYSMIDHEGFPVCGHCQSYLYETEYGDDTDTESEPDMQEWTSEEYETYFGSEIHDQTYEEILADYLFAKRRFRHMAKRFPRRQRFPRRNWSMHLSLIHI